jgi:hypothetical protein
MLVNKFFSADNNQGYDVNFNACVEGLTDLAKHRLYKSHQANSALNSFNAPIAAERNEFFAAFESDKEYNKKNDLIIKNMLMYAAKDIDFVNIEDSNTMKNPMLKNNPMFQNRFYAIVSMALPSIISGIVAYNYAGFGEVRDTAFGDTAKFEVPSSQLFVVSRSSTGERHGSIQRLYSSEFTVNTENYDITIGIDWFKLVTGRVDLGDWMMKIAQSFAQDIGYRAFKALDDSYSGLPAALKLGGFSEANFTTMAERVSAANGSVPIYATGTLTALGTVLPTDNYLTMGLGQEYVSTGYLGKFLGTNMIATPSYIKKGTIHSAGSFELLGDDNRLYFLPLGGDRPVKIVFEGNAIQIETGHDANADRELVISVKHKYGVAIATSAWYGIMEIA